MFNLHILQLSSFFFLPALILCMKLKRILGIIILGLNSIVSFLVHRLDRKNENDYIDHCDKLCISMWVLYNTYLVIEISRYLNKKWDIVVCLLLIISLIGAISSYYFSIKRKDVGKWRSEERNREHILMHMCGGIGTLFLLLAINRIKKLLPYN